MDGDEPDHWSAVAGEWAQLWGAFAEPAWRAVLAAAAVGPGASVLDIGCGSGDLLAHLAGRGMRAAGIDPAPGMVARARTRVPGADVRIGDAEHLPWPDATFDLVTSVNAVQFAGDTLAALAEAARVTVPGGHVAVANWAEAGRNDLAVIEEAVARADGEEPRPDGDLRRPGGLEELLTDAGLTLVSAGVVAMPWQVPDEDTLVHGVLLGEEPGTIAALAATVVGAAEPFRVAGGGYRLDNAFRYAVGRTQRRGTPSEVVRACFGAGRQGRRNSMFPAENLRDWRGEKVIDPDGSKIGELEAVYVDTATDEPAFATVRTGMLGRHKLTFVPLGGATVSPSAVRVRYDKKIVGDAPSIDVDGELAAADEPGVFAHYNLPYQPGAAGERRLARR